MIFNSYSKVRINCNAWTQLQRGIHNYNWTWLILSASFWCPSLAYYWFDVMVHHRNKFNLRENDQSRMYMTFVIYLLQSDWQFDMKTWWRHRKKHSIHNLSPSTCHWQLWKRALSRIFLTEILSIRVCHSVIADNAFPLAIENPCETFLFFQKQTKIKTPKASH